jgi:signal transduction histidine kinase
MMVNRKYIFCLTTFILMVNITLGQDNYLDSLIRATVAQKDDTNKINNLLLISRKYVRINKDKSLEFCDEAEKLSKELKYGKGIAGAWFERSIIAMKTGNVDTAIMFNKKSIQINESLKIYDQLAHNYNLMGSLLIMKNQSLLALDYLNKGLALFKKIGDSAGQVYVYNSLGNFHETLGNYDSAAFYYFNYIKLCESVGDEMQVGIGLINLASMYLLLEDYPKAREYSLKSLEYNQKYDRPDCVILAYKNLAIINAKEKNYDESIHYFNLSIDLAREIESHSELASVYVNMGNMYEERKQYDQALDYYQKAIQLAKANELSEIFANCLINLGLIYERKNNFSKALILYDSAAKVLEGSGNYYELSSVYHNIYKVYALIKDYKNAYVYQSKYYALKDSALKVESQEVVADLTFKYEKEKDQAKILQLENVNLQKDLTLRKRTNQKNSILFSSLGLLLIAIFILIFTRYKARKEKIIADQKIRQLEEEKRLLAARSIVNGQEEERKRIAAELHDGLGVLLSTIKMQFSSLKSGVPENQSLIDKATHLLEQATGDVRRISHNMMPGLLTKLGFFEAVGDLFDEINESGKVKAELNIEGEAIRLSENIEIMLYRIVQEMVNNTLKHAGAKNISLILNVLPDQLNIQFSDDGKGFDMEKKLKLKTIGLTSILSRVKFLNGEITIESEQGKGSTSFIQIPVSQK